MPYVLGSICLIKRPSEAQGRQLLAQVRGTFTREVVAAGQTPRLYTSIQKTKRERIRYKRLRIMASTVQQALAPAHRDAAEQTWRFVCWRSACVVVGGRRVATLKKIPDSRVDSLDTEAVWQVDWYEPSAYVESPDRIRDEVYKSLCELPL